MVREARVCEQLPKRPGMEPATFLSRESNALTITPRGPRPNLNETLKLKL